MKNRILSVGFCLGISTATLPAFAQGIITDSTLQAYPENTCVIQTLPSSQFGEDVRQQLEKVTSSQFGEDVRQQLEKVIAEFKQLGTYYPHDVPIRIEQALEWDSLLTKEFAALLERALVAHYLVEASYALTAAKKELSLWSLAPQPTSVPSGDVGGDVFLGSLGSQQAQNSLPADSYSNIGNFTWRQLLARLGISKEGDYYTIDQIDNALSQIENMHEVISNSASYDQRRIESILERKEKAYRSVISDLVTNMRRRLSAPGIALDLSEPPLK